VEHGFEVQRLKRTMFLGVGSHFLLLSIDAIAVASDEEESGLPWSWAVPSRRRRWHAHIRRAVATTETLEDAADVLDIDPLHFARSGRSVTSSDLPRSRLASCMMSARAIPQSARLSDPDRSSAPGRGGARVLGGSHGGRSVSFRCRAETMSPDSPAPSPHGANERAAVADRARRLRQWSRAYFSDLPTRVQAYSIVRAPIQEAQANLSLRQMPCLNPERVDAVPRRVAYVSRVIPGWIGHSVLR